MEIRPKVSVLIPTYNYGRFIAETLESVQCQSFQDFEIIVVDNCSSDNTSEVVAQFNHDHRLKYERNPKNLGMVGNFNRCLELAKGQYIKFLMADDRLHPDQLKRFVAVLDENPDIMIVTSDTKSFGAEEKIRSSGLKYQISGEIVRREVLKNSTGNFIGEPTSVMFRKNIERFGKFDDKYNCTTDINFWLRILIYGDLYVIPEVLSYFRVHNAQASTLSNYQNWFDEYLFYKEAGSANPYEVDLSGLGIDTQIKKTAIKSTSAIFFLLPRFWSGKNSTLLIQALKIGFREKVIFSTIRVQINQNIKNWRRKSRNRQLN